LFLFLLQKPKLFLVKVHERIFKVSLLFYSYLIIRKFIFKIGLLGVKVNLNLQTMTSKTSQLSNFYPWSFILTLPKPKYGCIALEEFWAPKCSAKVWCQKSSFLLVIEGLPNFLPILQRHAIINTWTLR